MLQRNLETELLQLLKDFRIVYLTGPRQSGKTTLVRSLAEKEGLNYYTLDDQSLFEAARNDPSGFINSLKIPAVLDEFQMVPELIPAIKQVSDSAGAKRGLMVLTGSADIFRSAKIQESLPGHIARIELHPLSFAEKKQLSVNALDYLLEGDFSEPLKKKPPDRNELASMLLEGGYPEVYTKSIKSRGIWFKSYTEGRLFKDFENIYPARGDYHLKVRALIKLLAGLSGNIIKYANISNDLNQDDKTVKNYIETFELLFLIKRLNPYVKNPSKRDTVSMPKIHFLDTGLASYLLGFTEPERLQLSHYFGYLTETLVYTELLKHSAWSQIPVNFYYYRDRSKNETDIVIEEPSGMVTGIEVKASSSVKPEDFRGLSVFADYAGDSFRTGILFYNGGNLLPFRIKDRIFYAVPLSVLL